MEKTTGNTSLGTQETQPVTLNGKEYRKPITEHTGNPTCDSGWRRVQETHHWAHRKPNLLLWMKKSTGNPSLSTQETQALGSGWRISEETVVEVYLHRFISLFLLLVSLLIEIFNYFALFFRDLMNTRILIPPFGWSLSSVTLHHSSTQIFKITNFMFDIC